MKFLGKAVKLAVLIGVGKETYQVILDKKQEKDMLANLGDYFDDGTIIVSNYKLDSIEIVKS